MIEQIMHTLTLSAKPMGDYLTDVRVQERWYYAFVGTAYCTEMQAMAYPKATIPLGYRSPLT
jgi:hypothetical protein